MKRYIITVFGILTLGIGALAQNVTGYKVVKVAGTLANVD
jgi:hypothetical protein